MILEADPAQVPQTTLAKVPLLELSHFPVCLMYMYALSKYGRAFPFCILCRMYVYFAVFIIDVLNYRNVGIHL